MSVWRTEEPTFKRIHLIMVLLFFLLAGYILMQYQGTDHVYLVVAFFAYLALAVFRHFYLSGKGPRFLLFLFPFLELGVIYYLTWTDANRTGLALIILLAWDVALDYPYSYGIVYALFSYSSYLSIYLLNYLHLPGGSILLICVIIAVQFVLFVGFAFLAKSYGLQSSQLRKTTAELHARMIAMEEMTVLKERNRIALEIHNTVGHQLTTALVQIEAAQMMLDNDIDESKRRLRVIKDQVRQGLQEIRQAIHAIKPEQEHENFSDSIKRLISQVRALGKVYVVCEMANIEEVRLSVKKTLYHVVLESITNAIRHGQCKNIEITLKKDNGLITLSSFNDGLIPGELVYGFGLNKMKENLQELGGSLTLRINEDGRFGLDAKLPVFYQEGNLYG